VVGSSAAQEPTQVPGFLTLADAVVIALEGSTRLGIQSAQLNQAKAARINAIFNLGPDLSGSFTTSRSTRTDFDLERGRVLSFTPDSIRTEGSRFIPVAFDEMVEPFTIDQDETSKFKQYQLSSNIRLFDGLANYYNIAASGDDVESDELDLGYLESVVQTDVIEAYYNLLRAKLLLNVATEAVDVAREQLERTQALYDLGSAARSDVLKSQVQLGQTRLELVQRRNGERQSRDRLIYSMNLFRATPFAIDTTIAEIPSIQFDFEELVQYAIANRLDIHALRKTEDAEGERVVVARGPLFPTLDFGYRVTWTDQESQFRFGAQQNLNRSWFFASNWAIFDRYRTWTNVTQQKARKRIAEYNRRQAELDAIQEIRDFVNQLREAQERLVVTSENVVRSEEDLRLAQEKFRVGAGTILDTITAESDLTSTKAAQVEAIVDFLIARAKLFRATGRPFSEL
jgi:outer membrane protein TolC